MIGSFTWEIEELIQEQAPLIDSSSQQLSDPKCSCGSTLPVFPVILELTAPYRSCKGNSACPPSSRTQPLPTPGLPGSHISLDFITGLPPSAGNTTILTIVDRFSKAAHFVAFPKLPTALETETTHHMFFGFRAFLWTLSRIGVLSSRCGCGRRFALPEVPRSASPPASTHKVTAKRSTLTKSWRLPSAALPLIIRPSGANTCHGSSAVEPGELLEWCYSGPRTIIKHSQIATRQPPLSMWWGRRSSQCSPARCALLPGPRCPPGSWMASWFTTSPASWTPDARVGDFSTWLIRRATG
ncbi:uncharacterized protein LOC112842083 [Oreochromis niloticus]|uniref:uncharacterized protein LOC112842083 n=1 Tax=Oreochromis niloticus TaxID=8128 RepID=UPI000DF15953|nr:uncharacterized protein LOC112842083 [Oreochromis niloticus]